MTRAAAAAAGRGNAEADEALRDGYKRPFDVGVIVAAHVVLLPLWALLWALIPLAIRLARTGHRLCRRGAIAASADPVAARAAPRAARALVTAPAAGCAMVPDLR